MDAWIPFYEREWEAMVTYRRMYRWDPRAIRTAGAKRRADLDSNM